MRWRRDFSPFPDPPTVERHVINAVAEWRIVISSKDSVPQRLRFWHTARR